MCRAGGCHRCDCRPAARVRRGGYGPGPARRRGNTATPAARGRVAARGCNPGRVGPGRLSAPASTPGAWPIRERRRSPPWMVVLTPRPNTKPAVHFEFPTFRWSSSRLCTIRPVGAMKFSVIAPVAARVTADPEWMSAFARHVEVCGFESIVVVEHTVLMTEYSSVYPYDESGRVELHADCPVPDPLDLLAFLAAHTDRLGLATGVLVLPNHHPVVLAKRVATLDALSGGRIRLCVGMGWLKEEIEACGAHFASRGRRADEQLEVMRLLWEDRPEGASFHGEFFEFDHAACYPKPAGSVPIYIGGHSVAAG